MIAATREAKWYKLIAQLVCPDRKCMRILHGWVRLVAFSEFERKRLERAVDAYVQRRRPAPHIRKQLDISFRIEGHSVELFEIRPAWRNTNETIEHSIIKATYVKRRGTWKVYWKRADLRWHVYDPEPEAGTIEDVLDMAERDQYGCFFG